MLIKKILFPTDFSRCSEQAFDHAIYLARKFDAEIHLLHSIVVYNSADYLATVEGLEKIYEQLKEISEQQMSKLIETHNAGDLKIERTNIPSITTGQMILDYADQYQMDLIVMGTHGRRGIGHLFLGSLAERVVREAKCPILTVRELKEPKVNEAGAAGKADGVIANILVPIDFSQYSLKALEFAKELASTYQAHLQLLHVVEKTIYASPYPLDNLPVFESRPDISAKLMQEMSDLFKNTRGPEVTGDVFVSEGRIAQEIAKFAQEKGSDLIVISTHGLTGLEHMLIGSITEKVVRMAPCPVFTVKTRV